MTKDDELPNGYYTFSFREGRNYIRTTLLFFSKKIPLPKHISAHVHYSLLTCETSVVFDARDIGGKLTMFSITDIEEAKTYIKNKIKELGFVFFYFPPRLAGRQDKFYE